MYPPPPPQGNIIWAVPHFAEFAPSLSEAWIQAALPSDVFISPESVGCTLVPGNEARDVMAAKLIPSLYEPVELVQAIQAMLEGGYGQPIILTFNASNVLRPLLRLYGAPNTYTVVDVTARVTDPAQLPLSVRERLTVGQTLRWCDRAWGLSARAADTNAALIKLLQQTTRAVLNLPS